MNDSVGSRRSISARELRQGALEARSEGGGADAFGATEGVPPTGVFLREEFGIA